MRHFNGKRGSVRLGIRHLGAGTQCRNSLGTEGNRMLTSWDDRRTVCWSFGIIESVPEVVMFLLRQKHKSCITTDEASIQGEKGFKSPVPPPTATVDVLIGPYEAAADKS